jgi:hypothetical protein
MKFN